MNTFTAKNEKETQSLLSQKNEEGETKKKTTTSAKKKNVFLTVGGLAAVGILGLASSKSSSSSFGSAAPFTNGSRLGQTQSTIRLSVGCSPQDVLSLLPFEPKSWRGAQFILLLHVYIVSSFIFLARSNFLSRNLRVRNRPKSCLTTKYDASLTFFLHSTVIPLHSKSSSQNNINDDNNIKTGKVGAKFITANMSPNFSYENAIDMPEEMCGVFAVPHELAHDARYGFFLYEKANPENFVSDIGVQPKGLSLIHI